MLSLSISVLPRSAVIEITRSILARQDHETASGLVRHVAKLLESFSHLAIGHR